MDVHRTLAAQLSQLQDEAEHLLREVCLLCRGQVRLLPIIGVVQLPEEVVGRYRSVYSEVVGDWRLWVEAPPPPTSYRTLDTGLGSLMQRGLQ